MKKIYLLLALFSLSISAKSQTTTFNWNGTTFGTGSVQMYTVPTGVTALGIDAKGGAGGSPYIYTGGDVLLYQSHLVVVFNAIWL